MAEWRWEISEKIHASFLDELIRKWLQSLRRLDKAVQLPQPLNNSLINELMSESMKHEIRSVEIRETCRQNLDDTDAIFRFAET